MDRETVPEKTYFSPRCGLQTSFQTHSDNNILWKQTGIGENVLSLVTYYYFPGETPSLHSRGSGSHFCAFLSLERFGENHFLRCCFFFTARCETVLRWPGHHLSRNLDSAKSLLENEVSISQPFWTWRNVYYWVERFKTNNMKEGLI